MDAGDCGSCLRAGDDGADNAGGRNTVAVGTIGFASRGDCDGRCRTRSGRGTGLTMDVDSGRFMNGMFSSVIVASIRAVRHINR